MKRSARIQYFVSFAVSLAAVTSGVLLAWITPVMPKFLNNETAINITKEEISWMASIGFPGFVGGSLMSRYMTDNVGRRATILGSAVPILIGTVIILNTTKVWLLYVTHFLWGVAGAIVGNVSTMYLAEISDKEIRGTLLAANRYLFSFGNFLVMCIGPFISYDTLNWIVLALPICYFIVCCFVPESPYYLLKEAKVDAARQALIKLGGSSDENELEERLTGMKSDVYKEMLRSGSLKELFTGKQYRKALVMVIGLKLAAVMTGSIAISQYLGVIIQECKMDIEMSTALIAFGAIKLLSGVLLSVIVDKIGRRPLLFYSFIGSAITLGISAYFFTRPTFFRYSSYVPFVGIIIFTVLSTVGYNSLGSILLAEIFPMNVKLVATTLINVLGGFLNFFTVKGYQQMKDILGLSGTFWFYAASAFLGALFTHFMAIETKGKSLREIQIELQGDIYDEAEDKLNKVVANEEKQESNEK
ncbi:facilitated trehalose transporter Tret1-like [Anticarsia gemmatalis]|uniref:facilitated trehalose transporter Tret1-like n=1 Tax=Anticarsia gemmatalis TaxID=129554 RepID=UPI003F75FCA1